MPFAELGASDTMSAMTVERLSPSEVADHLSRMPEDLCDLILAARELVLATVPEVTEGIKFNSLSYYRPNEPWGSIGGHVCSIGVREDQVVLGFIHGAFLPDPKGLLQGTAKSKRDLPIASKRMLRDPAVKTLLRASLAHRPG
jgi:hypothetical protein